MPKNNNDSHQQQDKLPPHDIDGEEACLGGLLINSDAIRQILWLEPYDFFDPKCALVFGACLDLHRSNDIINQISVAQELNRKDKLQDINGPAYLAHLVSIIPTSLHTEYYARSIKNASTLRKLIGVAGHIANLAYTSKDPKAVLTQAEEALEGIRGIVDSKTITITQFTILTSSPRSYKMIVNGTPINVTQEELLVQKKFKAKIMDTLDFIPILPSVKQWEDYVNGLLEKAEREAVPENASRDMDLKDDIGEWLDENNEAEVYKDLKGGSYVVKDVEGVKYYLFQKRPLLKSIKKKTNNPVASSVLWGVMTGWGAREIETRVDNMPVKLWALPMDFRSGKVALKKEIKTLPDDQESGEKIPEWF